MSGVLGSSARTRAVGFEASIFREYLYTKDNNKQNLRCLAPPTKIEDTVQRKEEEQCLRKAGVRRKSADAI